MLAGKIGREVTLRNALRDLKRERDVILIDCPPTLGLLTVNALVAADHALLTTEAQYFSLQGVEQAMEVVDLARDSLNPELELLGGRAQHRQHAHQARAPDARGAARALRRQGLPHRDPPVDRLRGVGRAGDPDPRLPARPRRRLPLARRRAAAAPVSGRSCSTPLDELSTELVPAGAAALADDRPARAALRARADAGARGARGAGLRRRRSVTSRCAARAPTTGSTGFDPALPEDGAGAPEALAELAGARPRAATRSSGPRFFHFVMGGTTPAALGADWLTSAFDQVRLCLGLVALGSRLEAVAAAGCASSSSSRPSSAACW